MCKETITQSSNYKTGLDDYFRITVLINVSGYAEEFSL